jgi:hypothetical protein
VLVDVDQARQERGLTVVHDRLVAGHRRSWAQLDDPTLLDANDLVLEQVVVDAGEQPAGSEQHQVTRCHEPGRGAPSAVRSGSRRLTALRR